MNVTKKNMKKRKRTNKKEQKPTKRSYEEIDVFCVKKIKAVAKTRKLNVEG